MATKDYKARERPKSRSRRRGGSGFFWFVTGTVFGAFGVGVAWTLHERAPLSVQRRQAQTEPPSQPNFVFHQLLPEMEVVVPDEEPTAAPKQSPPVEPDPTPEQKRETPRSVTGNHERTAKAEKSERQLLDGPSYLVQVASFRKASDAERLKARLALLGIRAKIQQGMVNGQDYYRVRAGPYRGTQQVNETRALLGSNGLNDSILIKVE